MSIDLRRTFHRAKEDGRLCTQCGWMISKKNWKKGYRLCPGCWDAGKGVNVPARWGKWRDEPTEKTGEML